MASRSGDGPGSGGGGRGPAGGGWELSARSPADRPTPGPQWARAALRLIGQSPPGHLSSAFVLTAQAGPQREGQRRVARDPAGALCSEQSGLEETRVAPET